MTGGLASTYAGLRWSIDTTSSMRENLLIVIYAKNFSILSTTAKGPLNIGWSKVRWESYRTKHKNIHAWRKVLRDERMHFQVSWRWVSTTLHGISRGLDKIEDLWKEAEKIEKFFFLTREGCKHRQIQQQWPEDLLNCCADAQHNLKEELQFSTPLPRRWGRPPGGEL